MCRRFLCALFFIASILPFFCSPVLAGKVPQRSWNLARDMALGFTGNPTGRWLFMENRSRDRVPSHFTKLPEYADPYGVSPRKAWNDPSTGTYIGMAAARDSTWPANLPVLRPMAPSMAVMAPFVAVAWKSPLTGKVNISGLCT